MKLAVESHERLENFLREFYQDPDLRLPRICLHRGVAARLLTRSLKVAAITFGHHVLISPDVIKTDSEGRQIMPGWLLAHEATHVLQFKREGYLRFLLHYFLGFWRALRESGKWGREARVGAYLAIAEERAAQEVQRAYQSKGTELKP